MTTALTLTCPRCGDASGDFAGCPKCQQSEVQVNMTPPLADLTGRSLAAYAGGPFGWADTLACPDAIPVSLGEGNTPTISSAVDTGQLLIKLEGRSPTGSHKDRGMAAGISAALALGQEVVVLASSGNAGVAAAAYAARAGMPCVVASTVGLVSALRDQILSFGAYLALYPTARERTLATGRAVAELGWFPLANHVVPTVGSNPLVVEGYKSVAYEIARDTPDADFVVIPTCRADLLAGVHRGYRELRDSGLITRAPKLVAAETSTGAAFVAALRKPSVEEQERTTVVRGDSPAFSIGSDVAVWQGLAALWWSDGLALSSEPAEFMHERTALAEEGILLEASSAVATAVGRRLARDTGGVCVVLGTANGNNDLQQPGAEVDQSRLLNAPPLDDLARAVVESLRGLTV